MCDTDGRPSLINRRLWQHRRAHYFAVFERALLLLRCKQSLPEDEPNLNRELHNTSVTARLELDPEGLYDRPTFESQNLPDPDEEFVQPFEYKRPDIQWIHDAESATDDRHREKSFVIECKRLGEPTNARWMLNEQYVIGGITRFTSADWRYGMHMSEGAMIAFIQNMTLNDIHVEVNGYAQREEIPLIDLHLSGMQEGGVSYLNHRLTRDFPQSPFHLRHMWLDIRDIPRRARPPKPAKDEESTTKKPSTKAKKKCEIVWHERGCSPAFLHMTPAAFKIKWHRFSGKETAAYQEHFNDLCRLLRLSTPAEADPTGNDTFCFQKYVLKDAELFSLSPAGETANDPEERGFADVWKAGCFAWEYKGKRANLDAAYKQLLRYRESLLNPPLLVVCDFDRYIIRTNFNGTVQETHEFTNAEIDTPRVQRLLRSLFTQPDALKPQHTTAQVTEKLAGQIAGLARSLQSRESVEYKDAANRRTVYVAQRKNLRIARFLNRVVFCLFAEDTGLLPANIFSEVTRTGLDDPQLFAESLEDLFRAMANGGRFGRHKIRHFNGHLFEEATVFELTADELRQLAEAAEADWQFIEPSIMGTLFERALEPEQRSQLGAHYTSEPDIKTLLEPVLMAPLRREWGEIKANIVPVISTKKVTAKVTNAHGERLAAFQDKLAAFTVLDPACGSGNFLYVSLQLLLALEKEVIAQGEQIGYRLAGPKVGVQQLRALEINPYAFELAQVAVQIGYLQWRRDNGFDNERTPVLQDLSGFENKDALLNETFRKRPKNLQAARAEEHGGQDELFKVYTERIWPSADVIVGNPPFLGGKLLRRELGSDYVDALFEVYRGAVPHEADLCCYWFEKARGQIVGKRSRRAGLLATQGIRGGANRRVLEAIKQSGDIFFAESDRKWTLDGAAVQVSMVGFDDGSQAAPHVLNGASVPHIYANLASAEGDVTTAGLLLENTGIAFMGDTKGGAFDLPGQVAAGMLTAGPNPNGRPNSDVVRPWINGLDVSRLPQGKWIIDFPPGTGEGRCFALRGTFRVPAKTRPA